MTYLAGTPSFSSHQQLSAELRGWSRLLMGAYLAAGLAWVVGGDLLFSTHAQSVSHGREIELVKGVLFVFLTTIMLWLLLYRMRRTALSAHMAVTATEHSYQVLFDSGPTPTWLHHPDTLRVLLVNDAALREFGLAREQMVGMHLSELGLFASARDMQSWFDEVAADEESVHRSLRTRHDRLGRLQHVCVLTHMLEYRASPARLIRIDDRSAQVEALHQAEAARELMESAERTAGVGSWRLDAATRSGTWSAQMRRLLGQTQDACIADATSASTLLGAVHADDRHRLQLALDAMFNDNQSLDLTFRVSLAGGCIRYLHGRGDCRAGAGFAEGSVQDITTRHEYERRLAESEQLFRSLVGVLPDGVLILRDDKVIFANTMAGKQFGYVTPDAMNGLALPDLFPATELPSVRAGLLSADAHSNAQGNFLVRRMRCGDGSTFQAEVAMMPVQHDRQPTVQMVVHDLSAEIRVWRQLSEQHDRAQQLSRRLITLQEDERRMIARELHDDIGQALTAMRFQIQLLDGETDPSARGVQTGGLMEVCNETLDKLRNLSTLLRPPQLDRLGIGAALRSQAEAMFRPPGPVLTFDVAPLDIRPAPECELACFRIAQESLTNVRRHADATHVTLRLRSDGTSLQLTVTDDGRGFLPESAASLGLIGMRERAQLAGGQLTIESRPGVGTSVSARLPLQLPAEATPA